MDDVELMARLKCGDRKAFDSIFLKYYPLLSRFCESLGGYCADCEDMTADILLDLWVKRESIEIRTSLRFYLYGAVRNRVYTLKGKSQKMQLLPENYAINTPAGDDFLSDQKLLKKDRHELIERFVNQLPEQGKLVFLLKWQHQLEYHEIAEVMQISTSTVKTHIYRAITYIRKQLSSVK